MTTTIDLTSESVVSSNCALSAEQRLTCVECEFLTLSLERMREFLFAALCIPMNSSFVGFQYWRRANIQGLNTALKHSTCSLQAVWWRSTACKKSSGNRRNAQVFSNERGRGSQDRRGKWGTFFAVLENSKTERGNCSDFNKDSFGIIEACRVQLRRLNFGNYFLH